MATVKINNQTIELPDEFCATDEILREALVENWSWAREAEIKRTKNGDKEIITVVKKAEELGNQLNVITALDNAKPHVAPAIKLAQELMAMGDEERLNALMTREKEIDAAKESGSKEQHAVALSQSILSTCAPSPSSQLTEGF